MEQVAVLINPIAGGGRALPIGRQAIKLLRATGLQVQELIGTDAADSLTITRQVVEAGVDAVYACGGDGIAHQAIQAVAHTDTALGVIPGGSGNDFARAIGVPLDNPAAAVAHSLLGSHEIDLARVGGTWFGTVLAAGFDSKVNDRVNRTRWPKGRARYNLSILAELAAFTPLPFTLDIDGDLTELDAMLVAVGNGSSYGGGMRICPGALLTDGLLDITVVSRLSRLQLIRLLPSVYPGRHIERREVLTFQGRSITINAPQVNAYADGEYIDALPITCQAVPQALRVLGPLPVEMVQD